MLQEDENFLEFTGTQKFSWKLFFVIMQDAFSALPMPPAKKI